MTADAAAPRPRHRLTPRIEGLEARLVLSAAVPAVAITSARTVDSQSVTFEYNVNSADLPPTIDFGVYRSADDVYDAGDAAIGSISFPTGVLGHTALDAGGQPAVALGHHTITLPIAGGLKIIPDQPDVLVVANPTTAIGAADAAARTGVIHTHSIAVVTHGGIQDAADDATGPLWQRLMAKSLKEQGYDSVIKYNWNKESRHPGYAHKQGPKLGRAINKVASGFPSGDPVDIHFIGHSEGAIVNSQAAQLLQVKAAPGIENGYIQMTMLDPHAANNDPKHQYSIKNGAWGSIVQKTIDAFQWEADDPIASVPKNVDDAEVFFQHTRVEVANTNHGVYNLWGQTPVRGPARYYDITGPGISHGGDFGVMNWYRFNVVPTLHDGGHFVDPTTLTGSHVLAKGEVAAKWVSTSNTRQPTFTGTAAPGATVTLFAVRSGSYGWKTVDAAPVDSSGHWTLTSRSLLDGQYRFAVRSAVPSFPNNPNVEVTPRLRLGSVAVHATHPRFRTLKARG